MEVLAGVCLSLMMPLVMRFSSSLNLPRFLWHVSNQLMTHLSCFWERVGIYLTHTRTLLLAHRYTNNLKIPPNQGSIQFTAWQQTLYPGKFSAKNRMAKKSLPTLHLLQAKCNKYTKKESSWKISVYFGNVIPFSQKDWRKHKPHKINDIPRYIHREFKNEDVCCAINGEMPKRNIDK